MSRIIVSVSNDLFSDQRVSKVCSSLSNMGYEVQLLGRKLSNSQEMPNKAYKIKRFNLWFTKGPLFYANLNIRLFFYLLFQKTDVLLANDLDTLAPNYLVSKLKNIPIVYDTHEYFTEVPELKGRFAKKVWEAIEKRIFPKLQYVFTVNDSIANIYSKKYNVDIKVIKNLPNKAIKSYIKSKSDLGLDENQKYIILQGAGINIDRGAEELVLAMKNVSDAKLLIVGSGDVLPLLKKMVIKEKIDDKITFIPKQNFESLRAYTAICEIGITLDKNTNLNYKFSLPNKLFDYIQSGIPVLASDLPEIKSVIEKYDIGRILKKHNPIEISKLINEMLEQDYKSLKLQNIKNAASELCWENQLHILESVYSKFI